jgi:DNA polymerase-3 subunit gamma/tau
MDLADYYRSLLFFLQKIDREALLGFHPDRFPEAVKTQTSVPQAERALESLLALYRTIRYSLSQRYELELSLSRLATLRHYVTPAELVQRIESLKAETVQGEFEKKN